MKASKTNLFLIAIFLLGLAVRVSLFLHEDFIGDLGGAVYARLGRNLIQAGHYAFGEDYNQGIIMPPGYPIFIGLTNLLIKDLLISGKAVSLLFSLATIILFYFVGGNLGGKNVGLFSALGFAIYPFILRTSALVASEATFIFFFFLSFYFFLLLQKKARILNAILFGILSAYTFLIRPEGFALLLLPVLFWRRISKNFFKIFVILVIFALGVSPYLLYLKQSTGKFILSGKGAMNYLEGESFLGADLEKITHSLNKEKTRMAIFEAVTETSVLDQAFRHPGRLMKKYAANFREETGWLFLLSVPVLFPLLFSFFSSDLLKNKLKLSLIFLFLFLVFILPLFFIKVQYTYSMISLLILIASPGFQNSNGALAGVLNFFAAKRTRFIAWLEKRMKFLVIVFLILSSLFYIVFLFVGEKDIPVEHIQAALFLKKMSPGYERINVMARKPWASFYSDARYTSLPDATWSDIIHFAKLYAVDFIVIDERTLGQRKNYDELIQLDKYTKEAELAYQDHSGKLIKIFKVINPRDGSRDLPPAL